MELAKLVELPDDEFIDQVNYRDLTFNIYRDSAKTCYYTIIAGKRIPVCDAVESYRAKVQEVIDENMFCVHDFGNDAKLIEFQNGEFSDFKLVQNHRILYVYVTSGDAEPDIDAIVRHAKTILLKYTYAK